MKKFATIIISAMILAGCASGGTSSSIPESSTYTTEISWADNGNYVCAVENPDFDGDVISAGTYTASSVGTTSQKGDIMVVWDIYVSDTLYDRIADLKEDEFVLSVGGIEKSGGEVTVEEGQYLYIKYNDVLGNPCGYVDLQLKK